MVLRTYDMHPWFGHINELAPAAHVMMANQAHEQHQRQWLF